MTTLTIEMPDDVFDILRKSPGEFRQEVRIASACHWYSQGLVSQAQGAKIAGLSRAGFIDELARRRVPVGQYPLDEVLEEIGLA
jgi:predicted HTH domain antitoxin